MPPFNKSLVPATVETNTSPGHYLRIYGMCFKRRTAPPPRDGHTASARARRLVHACMHTDRERPWRRVINWLFATINGATQVLFFNKRSELK